MKDYNPDRLLAYNVWIIRNELKKLKKLSVSSDSPLETKDQRALTEYAAKLTAAVREERHTRLNGDDIGNLTFEEQVGLVQDIVKNIQSSLRRSGKKLNLKTFEIEEIADSRKAAAEAQIKKDDAEITSKLVNNE